jgi:hypothetical protein
MLSTASRFGGMNYTDISIGDIKAAVIFTSVFGIRVQSTKFYKSCEQRNAQRNY